MAAKCHKTTETRQIKNPQAQFPPMAKILILHGPNLNLLGTREPSLYGAKSLDTINGELVTYGKSLGYEIICFQSNAEHILIEHIHNARKSDIQFMIINPAAFTHTSLALRDALLAVAIPFIEVHLSNIYKREAFRQHSYFSDIAYGIITGFGAQSYHLALDAIHHHLSTE